MEQIFVKVLNMSAAASVVIAVVLIFRLLLRRAPKKYSYLLWLAVAFRLLCPVSLSSVFSVFALQPLRPAEGSMASGVSGLEYISYSAASSSGTVSTMEQVPVVPQAASEIGIHEPAFSWETAGAALWIVGTVLLLSIALIRYIRLRRRLFTATRLEGNVWRSEKVVSPFVLGVFRPRIYVPYWLEGTELQYVLQHEKHHIRRHDPFFQLLAFCLLALHWFNPLCWLAFYLMSRDMEMSCDEYVLGKGGSAKVYGTLLLSFASHYHFPLPSPIHFGEGDARRRIKNILRFRPRGRWSAVPAGLLVCLALAACTLNPSAGSVSEEKALDDLEKSLAWEGDQVFFTLPEDYPAERWNIHIAGRLEDGDMSMSIHELEGEAWEAGKTYTLSLENRTQLTLDALLTGGEGEEYARSIDLLERGEMLGSLVEIGKEDIQLTLFQQGKAAGTYTGGWEVNGEYCYNSLLQMPFGAAKEPDETPAGDSVILKSGDVTLTAFQDSPLLLAEEGKEKRWLWSRGLETPYGILRLWLDEEEFFALGGGYQQQDAVRIPDRGQDALQAAEEFCTRFESIHLKASSGSSKAYTFVRCQVESALKGGAQFDDLPENTLPFYLTTVFVPENQRAMQFAMAGNTQEYRGMDSDVPQGAYEYFRCGYITRTPDGWQGQLVGTGW